MEIEQREFVLAAAGNGVQSVERDEGIVVQRIERLVPLFTQGRVWFPRRLPFRAADGTVRDFTHEFTRDEYLPCPVLPHDDMLDCLARLFDVPAKFPAPRRADPAPSRSPAAARTAYDPFTGQPR